MSQRIIFALVAVLGIAMYANGAYMLASPTSWYNTVPGVGRTGLFNQHFIRDIGILYLFIGSAFLLGLARADVRRWLWGGATLWLTCHAVFHFIEVATGICSPSYLATEFPAVTLPALIGIAATMHAARNAR